MDPYSIYVGAKNGRRGPTALLEWLQSDLDEDSSANIEQLRKVTEALCADNQRLFELTQAHERRLTALENKVLVMLCFVILLSAVIAYGFCVYIIH